VLGSRARTVGRRHDLEARGIDLGGPGGAQDRFARTDQQRPRDALVDDPRSRDQRGRVARVDDAERALRRGVGLAARALDQRVQVRMRVADRAVGQT
jgi:hypothetical protein